MVHNVPLRCTIGPPLANLGLWDYRGKNWDYGITPCLKLGLQKSALKLDYGSQIQPNWDFHPCKLGLPDFTIFGIGIMGLHRFWNWDYGITGPPYGVRHNALLGGYHWSTLSCHWCTVYNVTPTDYPDRGDWYHLIFSTAYAADIRNVWERIVFFILPLKLHVRDIVSQATHMHAKEH